MRITLLVLSLLLVSCGGEHAPPSRPSAAPAESPAANPKPLPAQVVDEPEPLPEPIVEDHEDLQRAQTEGRLIAMAKRRKRLAEQLLEIANQIDDFFHVGTAFNEIGIPQAACYAKGTLLGLDELVEHLDVEGEPDLYTKSMENAHDLRVQALEHTNFAHVLDGHIGANRDQVIIEWNLDCAGAHGIPAEARLAQSGTSSFYEIRNEGHVLMVLGDIEEGFASKVIAALEAHPSVKTVSLGSGGGSVYEAMQAGQYIRTHGYKTVLWNNCYSACPLVFMAGTQREIWSPYASFGFHQVYRGEGVAVSFDDPAYVAIARYAQLMGVDPKYVLIQMWSANPFDMQMVEGWKDELCEANLVSWVQRGCTGRSYVPSW